MSSFKAQQVLFVRRTHRPSARGAPLRLPPFVCNSLLFSELAFLCEPIGKVFAPLFSKRPPRGRGTWESEDGEACGNNIVFTDPMYEVFAPLFTKSGRVSG